MTFQMCLQPIEVKMSSYTCGICRRSYAYNDSLKRHMKWKHPENGSGKEQLKQSKTNYGFGLIKCNKCGQVFGTQEHLDTHIKHSNHIQFEQFPCMYCTRVFPTQEALDNHFHQVHTKNEKDFMQCTSTVVFNAPFTMYVVGPSRSGKTT